MSGTYSCCSLMHPDVYKARVCGVQALVHKALGTGPAPEEEWGEEDDEDA